MKNLKRLGLLLVAMLLISALGITAFAADAAPAKEPVCYNHGDMNSDGIVDNRDAIYTLYCFMLGEDFGYTANQDWDFDADGNKDNKDALYVLYAYMLDGIVDTYQLKGIVHEYYDPTWTWDTTGATVTASVTFKCGCGQTHTITTADTDGVTVTAGTVTAATCVTAGSAEYEAKVTFDGVEYTASTTVTTPAVGSHQITGVQGCETAGVCSVCGYEMPATGHRWVLDAEQSTEATCSKQESQVYVCETCGQTKVVILQGTVACQYEYIGDVNTTGCTYVKQYQCKYCRTIINGTVETDTYELHSYTATLTKEASCVSEGEKTYTCGVCDSSYTETVAANGSHNWVEDGTANGVISYHCGNDGCSETKTVVSSTSNEAALDSKDALDGNELQLGNGATLELDKDTVDGLESDKQLIVSVDEIDVEDTNLPDDLKAQVGDNVVYDFTMAYTDGQTITPVTNFDGKITVSLPYQLAEGEDIDSIDVWFINDEGEAEQVFGTYSNGYVTFTTEHFSYYSVTRLTPAQRCERYGHLTVNANKQATCTADGYSMSVCQRCGEQLSKTVVPMTGHSYEETVVAATCTTDGSSKKACTTCGHTITAVVPALGHSMELDASQSVAATCGAAGKNVYVCANCDHTTVDELAQLKHQYVLSQSQTADCTNKGFDIYVCSLCGGQDVRNEKAPLGHNYKVSQWNWSSDKLSATLELVCGNDAAHTHSISAVVTSKATGNVCDGQAITYTATASYNNISYTDIATGTGEAAGHTAGDSWITNANQHYHVCVVCGEKMDAEKHAWDEGTVTVEPTCSTAGSAIYTCTVCGFEKTKAVPATREHDYVNGVCSVCGKEEGNNCNHGDLEKVGTIDMKDIGGCAGEVELYSCECGKNTSFNLNNSICEFGEFTETEEKTADGYVYTQTGSCAVCGLIGEIITHEFIDADNCAYYYVTDMSLYMDGNAVVQTQYTTEWMEHPTVLTETVELTKDEFGICGMIIEIYNCYCGAESRAYTDGQCEWSWGDGWAKCDICGLERVWEDSVKDYAQCQSVRVVTYTFYMNGEEIYSCTEQYLEEEHVYEVTDYEMLGETCEDGLWVTYACTDCGKVEETDEYMHLFVVEQAVTDLSDYGFCASAIVQLSCPCSVQHQIFEFVYEGDEECRWQYFGYDEETGAETLYCETCGLYMINLHAESIKDENCRVWEFFEYTFTDADGNVVAQACVTYADAYHDYEYEGVLEGETCEDGVIIVYTCKDCGFSYEEYYAHHVQLAIEKYDLADYGLCGGYVVRYACACGEYDEFNVNESCDWYWDDEDENNQWLYCRNCGAEAHRSYEYLDSDHPCLTVMNVTYTYSFDGVEVLSVTCQESYENHEYTYDITLNEGAESCEDGYTYTVTCTVCGDSSSGYGSWCREIELSRVDIPEGIFCGSAQLVTWGCACGQADGSTYIEWTSDSYCDFDYGYWDEENGVEYALCLNCGLRRDYAYTVTQAEGSCKRYYTYEYTYSRDGETLYSYTYSEWDWSHRMVSTFEMEGETCEDGYYVYQTCLDCNYSNVWNDGGHNTYPISWEEVPEGIFCGKAYLIHSSCPCGERISQNLRSDCIFEWYDWDEKTNSDIHMCVNCGLIRVSGSTYSRIEGECAVQYERRYTYIRDDAEVYSYIYTYQEESHRYVYSYEMNGMTCDDGYTVNCVCVDCGNSDSWTSSGCSSRAVERWIVEDGILCGKAEVVTYRCGCGNVGGTYLEWLSDTTCDWEESYNQKLDCWVSTCANCGIVWYDVYSETRVEGTCEVYEINEHFYTRDGEVLLTYTDTDRGWSHNYIYSYELNGETCNDGYTYTYTCQVCGKTGSGSSYGHSSHVVSRVLVAEGIFCGAAELVTESCACLYYSNISFRWLGDERCYWENTYSEELGRWVDICATCGIIRDTKYTSMQEPDSCRRYYSNEYCYIRDGEVVLTYTYMEWDWSHKYIYTFELNGDSCEDGYSYTKTCQICGNYDTYEHTGGGHEVYVIAREDIEDGIFCGNAELITKSCACGRDYYTTFYVDCDWEWDYEEQRYTCANCGLVYETEQTQTPEEGTCKVITNTVCTFTRNGEVVYTFTGYSIDWEHEYTYTLELLGESCRDGYIATYTCRVCGDSGTYEGMGCTSYVISREPVAEGIFCGEAEVVINGCACGNSGNAYIEWLGDERCSFSGSYDDDLDTYVYTCNSCGISRYSLTTYFVDDATCREYCTTEYTYFRDGETLLTYRYTNWDWHHEYIYTFELEGETCEDGYWAYYTCQNCGQSDSYGSSGHSSEVISREDIEDGIFCGEACLITESCACGSNQYNYIQWEDDGCNFESQYDEDLEKWVEVCTECGVVCNNVNYSYYDAEACKEYSTYTYTYSRDGEEVLSYSQSYWYEQHNKLASFEMLGETCDDGYYVTFACHCGYTDSYSSVYYGCDSRHTIERIYLNTYGMCGGYLRLTSCPCGDNQWWETSIDCDYELVEDTEDGYDQRYCADCNTYIVRDYGYEYVQESCGYVGEWIFRIVRDGETLLDRTGILREPYHDYQVVNAELQGESCEDGVTLYHECTVCGRTKTSEVSYHYAYVISTVDLGELGTCGGTVKNYSCACGYNNYTNVRYDCYLSYVSSWDETDENGVIHYYQLNRCSDCGFERVHEQYTVYPEGSCTGTEHDINTYIVDGTVVSEQISSGSVTNHSYEYSYALAEGATVCSDGVVETYTCSVCGRTGSYTRYYSCSSNMIVRERIDLSEYGSVCGGYLAHSTCVCGQREKYDRVDMECDLDWNYVDEWIDDCVSGTYYTTEGHQYLSNDFYVIKCAVTDPACSLTIRYAKYWMVEGCEAVQYETWQLGYDEETGTCLKEITYATGNRRTYHPYEYTFTEETLDNGTLVQTDSYICPNCASSYVQKYYYYDDYYFKTEREAVNTLENGEKQYWYYTQEQVEFRENYYDESLEYTKYVYADGSEYWTKYEYTYSESGCIRTTVYTNSNGETDTYESTNHSSRWHYETLKESTCTQFGEYREYAVCHYCGETTHDYTYDRWPNGHNWYWNSEKQIYYCYDCGLENANGADGDIVLEDLTSEDDTDYVVGYWNSADVIFTTYLSVILEEVGEDVDNQLLLSDIEIRMLTVENDGVTAVAFDQAATLEAAAVAVADAGYTGSYAIRISFVPANSDTTLDYSITFDSITAE